MAPILLKVNIVKAGVTKTVQFEELMTVYDACRHIREKVPEAAELKGQVASYGLFIPDEDPTRGYWLEAGRTLKYYNFSIGRKLEYRTKMRPLRVRTLDEALRTVLVDDSHLVSDITKAVCARIGLHNPQEFSFTVDDEASQATLRRREQHAHDRKLEMIGREKHTDDQLHWLDPKQTLREQGLVDETIVLTLRKKFFFSDVNVNPNDPVQLHLLYVQYHEAIRDGTHPVTREEAIKLASLQMQAQYDNYEAGRFKKGFLKSSGNLKDMLPREYRKSKKIEQEIYDEHRKLFGLSEKNAKFRYIELCRSLRTFGVSFFAVKEKVPGRNKMRLVLLGISRESVMRLDMKTKAVLRTWPLTVVQSYASTPHSFSLNFGAYTYGLDASCYTVKTTEGEAIVQLLDGYIDLILQTKKPAGFELPEDTQAPIGESYVTGQQASAMKVTPGGVAYGVEGKVPSPPGSPLRPVVVEILGQEVPSPQLPEVQRILQETIAETQESVSKFSQDLTTATELPPLGDDKTAVKWKEMTLEVSRHQLASHLLAVLSSSASVVTLSSGNPQETDFTALGAAVSTIGTNMGGAADSSRLLAALTVREEDRSKILDASRSLADAIAALLKNAQPQKMNMEQMIAATNQLSIKTNKLLHVVEAITIDSATAEALGELVKSVAGSVTTLTAEARKVAKSVDDSEMQKELNMTVENTESAVQALIAATQLLGPYLESPLCQEKLMEACKAVAMAIDTLCHNAQGIIPEDDSLRELGAAAAMVTEALNALLQFIREGSGLYTREQMERTYETLLAAAQALERPTSDSKEMLRNARALAEATRALMQAIKVQANEEGDLENRRRLLGAIKELADATARMAEKAKGVAASRDKTAQDKLNEEAVHIVSIATSCVSPSLKQVAFKRLQLASSQAASASTQLMAAAEGATGKSKNEPAQTQLLEQCKVVAEQVKLLVQALQGSLSHPDDAQMQLELVNTANTAIAPMGRLAAAAKKVVTTITDEAIALQLGHSAKYAAARLGTLRTAVTKASLFCGTLLIDSAINTIRDLIHDVSYFQTEAQQKKLQMLPGQSQEGCSQVLVAASKTVESLKAEFVSAVAEYNTNNASLTAREMGNNLRMMVQAARGLAAAAADQESREVIFASTLQVLNRCEALMAASKLILQEPSGEDQQKGLLDAAKLLSDALKDLLNCLPGQIEFVKAIEVIQQQSASLSVEKLPQIGETPYTTLEEGLTKAAATLTSAVSDLLAAMKGTPGETGAASERLTQAYLELATAGMTLSAGTQNKEDQVSVLKHLGLISNSGSQLLLTAKAVAADPSGGVGQNQLTVAARSLVDAVNKLLKLSSSSRPGLKECEHALRELESHLSLLEGANEPVSYLSYYGCIEVISENLKALSATLMVFPEQARQSDYGALGHSIQSVILSTCEVAEAASQAAYLVGVADASSTAATIGVVDQAQLARSSHLLSTACQSLVSTSNSRQEILDIAAAISKHSSALCNASKLAASRTSNPLAKKEFLKAVKAVADSTANLLKSIDILVGELTDEHRQACVEASQPLTEAVEHLSVFASSPEFASAPARISQQGQLAQQPILEAGRGVLSATAAILNTSRAQINHPEDPSGLEELATAAKALTTTLEELIKAIEENCPGMRECDAAEEKLKTVKMQLEQASHQAMQHTLPTCASSTLQGFLMQVMEVTGGIGEGVRPLAVAAKTQVELLGDQVTSLADQFPTLAQAAIGAASKTAISEVQQKLLEHCVTLVESALQLVRAAKEAKGNSLDVSAHQRVDGDAKMVEEAVRDLIAVAEDACSESGLIGRMVEEVVAAMGHLEEGLVDESDSTFAEYQGRLLEQCEAIARSTHEMVLKGAGDPTTLPSLRRDLTSAYSQLVAAVQGCLSTMEGQEYHSALHQAAHVLGATHALGESLLTLLHASAGVQVHPEDQTTREELAGHAQTVKQKVSQLVSAVQSCGEGTHACLKTIAAIRELVGDIDVTASLLSTAGALRLGQGESEESGTFGQHRGQILDAAQAVADATKNLVENAQGSQKELAKAANHALETLNSQADLVKQGAASLPPANVEGQLLLLTAVKDVTSAVEGVVEASNATSGRSDSHPSTEQLKNSAKRAEVASARLLRTVSGVEEGGGSGTQVLQNTIDFINYAMEDFELVVPWPRKQASLADLRQCVQNISLATAKTVAAGKSLIPGDLAVGASMGWNAVSDLLINSNAFAWSADSEEDRASILSAARETVFSYKALLEHLLRLVPNPSEEGRKQLEELAREVTTAAQELLEAVEEMRGDAATPEEYHSDSELSSAATTIDLAAAQFDKFHPKGRMETDSDSPDLNAEILETTKETSRACGELVRGAVVMREELQAQEVEEEQWTQGILTAAKRLATEASGLCETTNMYIQCHASEEKLVSAAKAVASATAQLFLVTQVKTETGSERFQQLQGSAASVKKATDKLVLLVEQVSVYIEDDPHALMYAPVPSVGEFRPCLTKQDSEVAQMQVEMDRVRRMLAKILVE